MLVFLELSLVQHPCLVADNSNFSSKDSSVFFWHPWVPGTTYTQEEQSKWDWRDGLGVQSIYCLSRGPRFSSQHPRGSL